MYSQYVDAILEVLLRESNVVFGTFLLDGFAQRWGTTEENLDFAFLLVLNVS